MSQPNDIPNVFDPTGLFKSMRDSGMESWSKMMVQLVNTDTYGEATGKLLDAWLANSAPFRKVLESALAQALANVQLPTRADVVRLAERLTNIEMRLDDLDAKVDESLRPPRKAAGARGKSGPQEKTHDGK